MHKKKYIECIAKGIYQKIIDILSDLHLLFKYLEVEDKTKPKLSRKKKIIEKGQISMK